jgi:hypothetical protein
MTHVMTEVDRTLSNRIGSSNLKRRDAAPGAQDLGSWVHVLPDPK